ncbi:MAG: PIG-L family deacetylase [Bacteroidetes bacterium]|nr:MAG: PIG-L family deacetylase [Bacteroidota bacterium]MBL1145611.1 PIG-L family deacetylase [Bacteroidota bacterium]NOG58407.1 PIG-L family deacetylase [Bacteroidota bacterium]
MKIKNSRILVLAPHTDDGEFGCGGTIAKLIEDQNEVYYVAFSTCEKSVPSHLPKDILSKEVKLATSILGIPARNLKILNYEVREFIRDRQKILEDLIEIRKSIKPDIVFMPSLNDVHQDHKTIAEEGLRAFKFQSIFSYELPWNNLKFQNTLFIKLEERHIKIKVEALNCYESQQFRTYGQEAYSIPQAKFRGLQSGCENAEVFEVIRLFF